jgi:hypothetical protein
METNMPDGRLYDDDFHAWSLDQATRLRDLSRLQAPEAEGVDFEHIAEEIEDLGNEQRFQVESNLIQAISHLIKVAALPDASFGSGWRKEIRAALGVACDRFKPSMAQRIDMGQIWRRACVRARQDLEDDGVDLSALPRECPYDLETLVDLEYDLTMLVATMQRADFGS